eukprot:m.189204 g.189204  ORF g.189204 m.189204 type:complete len:182 (-) comp15623_c0_seq15:195-740(-)
MLGSVAVIITALVVWLSDWEDKDILDPILSLIIVCIIVTSTVPLVKESILILMETMPSHIDIEDIEHEVESLDHVENVHHFHCWKLTGNIIMASVHVSFSDCSTEEYMETARKIRSHFHKIGIHSLTIQPEFSSDESLLHSCLTQCPEKNCVEKQCCPQSGQHQVRLRRVSRFTTSREAAF